MLKQRNSIALTKCHFTCSFIYHAMDEGVEPPQRGLAAITGFKPDKHANAIHQNYVLLPRLGSNQSYEVQSLACCLLHHRGLLHPEMRSPLFKVGGQTLYR